MRYPDYGGFVLLFCSALLIAMWIVVATAYHLV